MFKNKVAYLIFIALGLPGILGAQPFNQAQEEAFAKAVIQFLKWVGGYDRSCDNVREILEEQQARLADIQGAFEAVRLAQEGLVTLPGERRRVTFARIDFNGNPLIDRAIIHLGVTARLLALLIDGPCASDENARNGIIQAMRLEIRALLLELEPILTNTLRARQCITIGGQDLNGRYEDDHSFDIHQFADLFLNYIRASDFAGINEEEVFLRDALDRVLVDITRWIELTYVHNEPAQPASDNGFLLYRFHEGQLEAFAHAIMLLTLWIQDAQAPNERADFEALMHQWVHVRSAFAQVVAARTQAEAYEFLFGVIEEVIDDEDLNELFVDIHAERVGRRMELNRRDAQASRFNYDGILLLRLIDDRMASVEELLKIIVTEMHRNGLNSLSQESTLLLSYWEKIQLLLTALFEEIDPILLNVYRIREVGQHVGIADIMRNLEAWLAQFEDDYQLQGGLAPQEPVESLHHTDNQEEEDVNILFEQDSDLHQAIVNEGLTGIDNESFFQNPVAQGYREPQPPAVEELYPQQVYLIDNLEVGLDQQPDPCQGERILLNLQAPVPLRPVSFTFFSNF